MRHSFIFLPVAITVTLLLGSSLCNEQYITLYTQVNQQGNNLTLDRHYANLSEHKDFLRNVSSYCAVGWIAFYTNPNFNIDGGIAFLIDQNDETPKCQNRIFSNYNSMRYLGNKNTDIPSVSLYSKANYHGLEVLANENGTFTGDLNYPVLSLVTTGWANYTFHQGANFNGTSWCVQSTKKVQLIPSINATLSNIGSISLGCKFNSTNVFTL